MIPISQKQFFNHFYHVYTVLPIIGFYCFSWFFHFIHYLLISYCGIWGMISPFFLVLTQGYFREQRGERKGEKHRYKKEASIGCLLYAWTGNWTLSLAMCPDQELNPQPFCYGMMLQPTEPHQPGWGMICFIPLFIYHFPPLIPNVIILYIHFYINMTT